MLTESLFADECEPFFNSIGPEQTFAVLQSQIMAHNQARSRDPTPLARSSGGG